MKTHNSLIGVLTLVFFITGCGTKKEVFKVGVNLPLTGTVAYYGISAQKGIELAIDELKTQNQYFRNVKIELVNEDNQGQASQAVQAMNKLIHVDKVPVVIGGGSSTETMAAAPIANENQVVLISPISSATTISKAGDYIFRTCPTDLNQAQDLGEWVLENRINKIAIIYANSTWGTGFKNDFVDFYSKNNGVILATKSSDPGDMDFRSQLTVIKSLNPEALVFIIYAKEGGTLCRQARELGLTQPIFGADPWSQKDFRTNSGLYSEGIMYTTPVQFDGESFNKFRAMYVLKYNQEPDVYSSNGYDCMMLLANLYLDGARTGVDFQRLLSNVTDFMGATGITHFDNNGDVTGKKFGRFVIRNGEPHQIKKLE